LGDMVVGGWRGGLIVGADRLCCGSCAFVEDAKCCVSTLGLDLIWKSWCFSAATIYRF